MTQEELQNIINKIEDQASKEDGVFGIFQYGGGSDESFIRANKQGLMLFANELLKAAKNSDEIIADTTKNIITIDYESAWIDADSNTFVQYIEPIIKTQNERRKSIYKATFLDKLTPVGCVVVIIILIITLLVGLWTLGKWIF